MTVAGSINRLSAGCAAGEVDPSVRVAGERIGHVRRLKARDGGLNLGRCRNAERGPRRIAVRRHPHSAAAPAMPRDPAMTSTCPNSPLWLSRGRGPRTGTASTASSVIVREFLWLWPCTSFRGERDSGPIDRHAGVGSVKLPRHGPTAAPAPCDARSSWRRGRR